MADDEKNQWYYNTVKQRAEYGKISPIEQRMGPYKTKEDAEHAWDIVVDRNAKWMRKTAAGITTASNRPPANRRIPTDHMRFHRDRRTCR